MGDLPYDLCKLVVTGGAELKINTTNEASIFFDTSENCGLSNGADQLIVNSGGRITTNSKVPGFYFKGTSNILLYGDAHITAVIYAPHSNVTLSQGFAYDGVIVSKNLRLSGGGTMITSFDPKTYNLAW